MERFDTTCHAKPPKTRRRTATRQARGDTSLTSSSHIVHRRCHRRQFPTASPGSLMRTVSGACHNGTPVKSDDCQPSEVGLPVTGPAPVPFREDLAASTSLRGHAGFGQDSGPEGKTMRLLNPANLHPERGWDEYDITKTHLGWARAMFQTAWHSSDRESDSFLGVTWKARGCQSPHRLWRRCGYT